MGKKKTFALALRLLGCWFSTIFMEPAFAQDAPAIEQFIVIDERPPIEGESKVLSIIPISCAFYVYRYGDQGLSLSRIEQLRQDLTKILGNSVSNKTMIVKHYALHVNARDSNLLGAAALTASACPREDTPYEYDRSKVANTNPPVIAYLEVVLDGKTYAVRNVFPVDIDLTSQPAKRQTDYFTPVKTHMHSALAELITKRK
jgi:hypothetical protein